MNLHPFLNEVLSFAGFAGVALGAHLLHKAYQKKKARKANSEADLDRFAREIVEGSAKESKLHCFPKWMRKHAPRFLIFIGAACGHPATVTAAHEYAVHFVVYSGYVIRGH